MKKAKPGQIKIEYTGLPDCAQFHCSTGLPQQSICGLMPNSAAMRAIK
ncbi:hypothetical protein [Nitrosomonas sp.]|nr:hypothetical protein [Nitrosomonas sp.]MDP2225129.1 hypothetical protein [Nitrosomonas sp.]